MLQISKNYFNLLKKRKNRKQRELWKKTKIKTKIIKNKNIILITDTILNIFFKIFFYKYSIYTQSFMLHYSLKSLIKSSYKIYIKKTYIVYSTLFFFRYYFNLFSTYLKIGNFLKFKFLKAKKDIYKIYPWKNKIKKQTISIIKFFSLSLLKNITSNIRLTNQSTLSLLQRCYTSPKLISVTLKSLLLKNKNFNSIKLYKHINLIFSLAYLCVDTIAINYLIKKSKQFREKSVVYYIDHYKSPLRNLSIARSVHQRYSRRKTLRNVAYKQFLKRDLKKISQVHKYKTKLSYFIRSYNFCLSWTHTNIYIKLGYLFINGVRIYKNINFCYNDIIQLPFIKGLLFLFSYFNKKILKTQKKLKKQSYIRYLNFIKPWTTRKKNILHLTQWVFSYPLSTSKWLIFDYFIFSGIYLYKNYSVQYDPYFLFNYNSTIKLYSWKFRST